MRDMGPTWEVPAIRAGGAVEDPLPSICILTLGKSRLKASAQRVIRLFKLSEPTQLKVPETSALSKLDNNGEHWMGLGARSERIKAESQSGDLREDEEAFKVGGSGEGLLFQKMSKIISLDSTLERQFFGLKPQGRLTAKTYRMKEVSNTIV